MYVDIKMENMNDVKRINEFACGCDFDVFVSNSTSIIDAKSININPPFKDTST